VEKKYYSQRPICVVSCLDKLTKFRDSMQDTSKMSNGKHKLALKIKKIQKCILYMLSSNSPLIATFREENFAIREKIEKNGRVINHKENTKFSRLCPKSLPLFPKVYFGLSKDLWNPLLVWELPFFSYYRLEDTPLAKRATFSKIYHGDYKKYLRKIIPKEWMDCET